MSALGQQDGMTLVEVLIAGVLMIVVLGATLGALTAFQRNHAVNAQQNDGQEETRRSLDLIARDLRNLASPTPYLPLAVDRAAPQDLIFQSEAKTKPAGSFNAQNTMRVRYCLDTANRYLRRQMQTWTTSAAPPAPTGAACPADGWTTSHVIANHVVNGGRPMFVYNSADLGSITEISTTLFVDVNPGRPPAETTLQTSVYLRNQNRAPKARFTWAPGPGSTLLLNGSESTDPEEKAMTYEWWDETTGQKVGEGILFTYTPPVAGVRQMYLKVTDGTLEDVTPTETVCATGPGVTCP
jgi:hypothetical protein